jgi:enoyl-CoA hydratase/carnithine racemase
LGILILNNPKALHALTHDMIDCMEDIFHEWSNDNSLKAILIKSSEAKRPAFCAGGDVKSVYERGIAQSAPEDFFYHEYKVNHAIATSKTPIVSFWDGVVMGGGAGISVHGKYRVATENTLFAMPECAIGLFPDVGSMWWMNRLLKRPVANYLALTGKRIAPADLMHTGLATHYVPSNQLNDLELALAEATELEQVDKNDDIVARVLMSFHETIRTDDCFLAINKQTIENTFCGQSVEEILDNLKKENSEFANSTIETLQKMSPMSMKVSMEALNRGAECKTIGEDLQMEYRVAKACMRPGSDFFEGIRAVLIDKDHSPKWNPSSLEGATDDLVQDFFAPIENEWPIPSVSSKL